MTWTVVPQNVTKTPRLSYIVPMTAHDAENQLYNMQNQNNYLNNGNNANNANNFMETMKSNNEKITADKADDAIYKATSAQYMAEELTNQVGSLIKSESFIYIIIAVILISLILVYRMVM